MSCKCQGCKKQYKTDLIILDKLWEKIKPKNKARGCGLLCPRCIGKRIEKFDIYAAYKLEEL